MTILNRQQTLHLFSRIFSIFLMIEQTQSQMCHCFDNSYISLQGMFDFDNTRSVSLSPVATEHMALLNCLSCTSTQISFVFLVAQSQYFLCFCFLYGCVKIGISICQNLTMGGKSDGWILCHRFGFVKKICLQTQKLCYVSLLE